VSKGRRETGRCEGVFWVADFAFRFCLQMFANVQKTQELWMWKMEYLHHEQRPLYFGEWF
jgi:hypothetical protein